MQTFREFVTSQGLAARTAHWYDQRITRWNVEKISAEEFIQCGTDGDPKLSESKLRFAALNKLRQYQAAMLRRGHTPDELTSYAPICAEILDFRIKRPTPDPVPKLSMKQCRDLLDAGAAKGARSGLLIALLYAQGLRIAEALDLQVNGLDFENMVVKVQGKTGWRQIPLHPYTERAARRWLEHRHKWAEADETRLIVGPQGGRLDDKGTVGLVRKLLRAANCPEAAECKRPCHSLRHAFATHMYRQCRDVKLVSLWLGHSNTTTTERYISMGLEDMQDGMAAHPLGMDRRQLMEVVRAG